MVGLCEDLTSCHGLWRSLADGGAATAGCRLKIRRPECSQRNTCKCGLGRFCLVVSLSMMTCVAAGDNLTLISCILRCSMHIHRDTNTCIAQAPGSSPVSGVTGRLDLVPRAGSCSSISLSVACPASRASTLRIVGSSFCLPPSALRCSLSDYFRHCSRKKYAPQLYLTNLFF